MSEKTEITEIAEDTVAAYFDLEFCNDSISKHNFPVSIGISYRRGDTELGNYFSVINFGDMAQLRREQLHAIGYCMEDLEEYGSSMEDVTEELLAEHKKYHPEIYVSFGKQDEDLLRKFMAEEVEWNFCDAIRFLPKRLEIKYDISLEKYAYICELDFVHEYQPLEDARCLAEIVWRVLHDKLSMERKEEVSAEYDRRMFIIQYQDRKRACQYLNSLPELTPKQRDRLKKHQEFLKANQRQYIAYMVDIIPK